MRIIKPTIVILCSMLILGLVAVPIEAQKRTVKKASKRKAPTSQAVRDVESESGGEERKAPGRSSSRKTAAGKVLSAKDQKKEVDFGKPTIRKLTKAGTFEGDVRTLSKRPTKKIDRPETEAPDFDPILLGPPLVEPYKRLISKFAPAAPAPTPSVQFNGLAFNPWGSGFPSDVNGDVGPNHYIQTINTAVGIYDKTGTELASFSFDTFMSQGNFGNLCDTDNFGDPIVLYDTFEDRWVLTDFAFQLSGGTVQPPGGFQCVAVSQTGDPISGGWNFYSIQFPDGLNDYPKLGVWPDGIYMTLNMFGFGSISGSFLFTRQFAFNKAQMYAGHPNPQIVTFDAPRLDQNGGTVFTIIPSNARLQAGTPPAGTPNYFVGTGTYTNALSVYRFDVDWDNVLASSFTGVTTVLTGSAWLGAPATVPSQGGSALDTLAGRAMVQNQYSNIGGAESLWLSHTVRGTGGATHAGVRWYQANVTGGTIAANTVQTSTHSPDNTVNRFMPSLAVDRQGNMMVGYSASNASMKPAIRHAGRLAADPASTLPQTEVDMIQGAGTQSGTSRWGDYSAMTLDPDGCSFWYTNQYYLVDGLNYQTRIGRFAFPSCTTVASGTVSGTVTDTPGGTPINGASVTFGSRTATTAPDGTYSFTGVPAGSYASISASAPGRSSSTTNGVVVPEGGTSTNNFALATATQSACLVDTSQAEFSQGTPSLVDLATTPGDVSLSNVNLDQHNESIGGTGVITTTTTWIGQTFTPTVSGLLTRADISVFCSACSGTPADLTLSIRATAADLPTGPDLATATIPGFLTGTAQFYSAAFATPASLTAGTKYAMILRVNSPPPAGNYATMRTGNATGQNMYSAGDMVESANSGSTWAITTRTGVVVDAGFRTYMTTDAGTLESALNDSNPFPTTSPTWSSLSWTGSTPGGTSLQFQVAGSNNPNGPFNFVGPDTTAATFYTTSGGSLVQFNGMRYLKYKAYAASSVPGTSPTLSDVTVCFSNQGPTAANVSVSGRVLTRQGRGVSNAIVTLVNSLGTKVAVRTNTFGAYRFTEVPAGQSYTVSVEARGTRFSPRFIDIADNIAELDFIDGQ